MAEGTLHALVRGRVQGVGFRWHVRETGRSLLLSGWVANLTDGRVEVFAEGDEQALESLVAWLQHGPPAARVERVDVDRDGAASAVSPAHARIDW